MVHTVKSHLEQRFTRATPVRSNNFHNWITLASHLLAPNPTWSSILSISVNHPLIRDPVGEVRLLPRTGSLRRTQDAPALRVIGRPGTRYLQSPL